MLIKEAVESILSGTILPMEIWIILDSADAEDRSAADSLLEKHNKNSGVRLCVEEGPGNGPAGARNFAVRKTKEPYVAFLDSDDLWEREKLEKQISYLKARPHLPACQTEEVWLKNGIELEQKKHLRPFPGRFLKASFFHCLISPSALLMEREIFLSLGGFDESFPVCEDFEFYLRYLRHYSMGCVMEKLTVKRSGDWPQLSGGTGLDYYRILAILKFLKNEKTRESEKNAAMESCRQKLAILKNGAAKRGRMDAYADLEKELGEISAL